LSPAQASLPKLNRLQLAYMLPHLKELDVDFKADPYQTLKFLLQCMSVCGANAMLLKCIS